TLPNILHKISLTFQYKPTSSTNKSMLAPNSINIDANGKIVIQDKQNGNLVIDPNNTNDVYTQLKHLNNTQIDSLLQVAAQGGQLSDLFKTLLNGVANEKNIVKGNISKVDTVNIGDHYHYYPIEKKLPKELTL